MTTATSRKNRTPATTRFGAPVNFAELCGSTQNAVENLQLLHELIDRGDSGKPLQLSFEAATSLSRLLYRFSLELSEVSDTLSEL